MQYTEITNIFDIPRLSYYKTGIFSTEENPKHLPLAGWAVIQRLNGGNSIEPVFLVNGFAICTVHDLKLIGYNFLRLSR